LGRERHQDVQAAPAGGLDPRADRKPFKRSHEEGGVADLAKGDLGGIEIEQHQIGTVEASNRAAPRVDGDVAEVHEVCEGGTLVTST